MSGLAETEWNLAQLGFYTWDVAAALAHGERALILARELDVPDLIARSLNALAYARLGLGQWEAAEEAAEEAAARFAALGNRAMEADSLVMAADARIHRGRPREGISAAREARAISLEIDNPWGRANSGANLARGLLEIGAYAEALQVAEDAVLTARGHGLTQVLIYSLIQLGAAHRTLLNLDAARTAHLEAMALSGSLVSSPLKEASASELCADHALAGSWDEAHAYAQQALLVRDYTFPYQLFTRWHETEALLRGGDRTRAEEDAHHFGQRIGSNRRYRLVQLRMLAVLAQAHGALDQTIAYLDEAVALAADLGLPSEQWQTLMTLGEVYRAVGAADLTRRSHERAAAIVGALGQQIDNAQLRASFLTSDVVLRVLSLASGGS